MSNLTAWDKVTMARRLERPKALDYINSIFEDFIEFGIWKSQYQNQGRKK